MNLPRVAILISGSGSNMVALIKAMQDEQIAAQPVLVLSNDLSAKGLERAADLGVPGRAIDHRPFGKDRSAFEAEMQKALLEVKADIVACAGFMRIMTEGFVRQWQGRMLNIHPSLLPLFKGLDTHIRALEAGVAVHGCTVHEVVPNLDSGPILGQAVVPVCPGDTSETLAKRVLRQEHRLYPAVLGNFVQNADLARREPIALLSDEA